ncbi:MAG: nucleotidyl transferase AbiEii/AbiGii toxin family protein [Candidatus Obscuribacterales bacterium]|nr:nucleotidyl transferase AbiEii/AbiGii toxin family protein [Candidatus Obscuribacterales bacterium]
MITESILGRIIHSSGVDDERIVRLDVISVYLLQAFNDAGMFDHMCFKGGNSLRKIFARRPSRFSLDLDFVDASYQHLSDAGLTAHDYYRELQQHIDQRTIYDIHWRVAPVAEEELNTDSVRFDIHYFIYDDKPDSKWQSRTDNLLAFECSLRRPVLLPKEFRELREESWFKHLEFTPSAIPVLQLEEAMAEKIRAAFQRNNARDLYDLYQYNELVFNPELVRIAAVLKCWQDRGLYSGPTNFDPVEFFTKLQPTTYNWEPLKHQVAPHAWVEPAKLLQTITQRYGFLSTLTDEEQQLCLDRWQKRQDLHDSLWHQLRTQAAVTGQ